MSARSPPPATRSRGPSRPASSTRRTARPTPATLFSTQVPSFADNSQLSQLLQQHGVTINAHPANAGPSFMAELLFGFGPTLLLVVLFVVLMRRAAGAGGAGGLMSFGRSRARRVEAEEQTVTFADVAGIDEAKEELTEIVDFLKNPDKYARLGGKIPRGVLLSGAPGTGKTLLARAVAGEAGVPFFQMSASEFVEMIVGVGASRVRDLFSQAKEAAPAIIFIDELDAVGRSRAAGGANISGGHDEREQTLNQILTEMDGFDPRQGVIVLGATNRPEVLDPALLSARGASTAGSPCSHPTAPAVRRSSASTPAACRSTHVGQHRADRLLDARNGRRRPREPRQRGSAARRPPRARARHLAGLLRRARADRARRRAQGDAERGDRRRIAYHEAGHAIVGMLTPGADPVRKVSIIPRGQSLGRHLLGPGRRPLQLRGALPARADQGRARRARRRGDRVRGHDHRSRVRHPAADPDRAADGRAAGG